MVVELTGARKDDVLYSAMKSFELVSRIFFGWR
jgi:hypothetical protein